MFPHLRNLTIQADSADLWIVEPDGLIGYSEQLKKLLSADEISRLERFTNLEGGQNFLFSKGICRLLSGIYLNKQPSDLSILSGDQGKPFLQEFPNFHFNISHSRGMLVLLFSPNPGGVDIESTKREIDLKPILKRFFSVGEIESWKNHSEKSEKISFLRGWTRKEAFLKATGEGISGLGHTEISFEPGQEKALVSRFASHKECDSWFFSDFELPQGFMGATVVKGKNLPIKKRFLKID